MDRIPTDVPALSERELRRDLIPAVDYSREFHDLEMERLWPRVWQIACREEEIPSVGDYVNYEIGKESILIVRESPTSIKAYYNVCPHRGRRLRDDACGNVRTIFCGYHAWTFDLSGKPIRIPGREDWAGCPHFSDADLSLTSVKVETWGGWVWINLDPNSESLRDFLQYLPEKTDAFEFELCRIRSYQTIIFPVNWKIVLEAFIEGYHTNGTHPEILLWGDMYLPGFEEDLTGAGRRHGSHMNHQYYTFDGKSAYKTARDYVAGRMVDIFDRLKGIVHEDGLAAANRIRAEVPEDMPLEQVYEKYSEFLKEEMEKSGARWPMHLTPEHFASVEWHIFANSSVLPSAEGAFWYRMRPNGDDPNSMIFDLYVLGRYGPGKEPDWEHEFYPDLASFKGKNPILEQDFSNLLAVHKGVQSRSWKAARPNPIQESNIYNFHRVLRAFVFGEAY